MLKRVQHDRLQDKATNGIEHQHFLVLLIPTNAVVGRRIYNKMKKRSFAALSKTKAATGKVNIPALSF